MSEHILEKDKANDLRTRFGDEVADLYLKMNDNVRYYRKCYESVEQDRDDIKADYDEIRSLLYRLVIKKDGTARQEAEALLKGER